MRKVFRHVVVLIAVILISSCAARSQELLETPAPIKVSPVRPDPEKPTVKKPNKKVFLLLSGGVYTAAILDMHSTIAYRDYLAKNGFHSFPPFEEDPLARPLVQLPKPAYYATGLALATGVNYLSWRMAKSRHLHKVWFLPQVLSIVGNSWGYST